MGKISESSTYGKKIVEFVSTHKQYRIQDELKWYVLYNAYENNHFYHIDRKEGRLERLPLRPLFNPIPELKKQVDSFENLLTSLDLLFFAYPKDLSTASTKSLKRSYYISLLLQDYFDENIMGVHQWIHDALMYPVSFLEVKKIQRIDPNTGIYGDDIEYDSSDIFDMIFDPRYKWERQERIIKIIRSNENEIKENSLYKIPSGVSLKGDFRDYKSIIEQDKFGKSSEINLFQSMSKEIKTQRKNVGTGTPEVKTSQLRICTTTVDGIELRNDIYEGVDFYPIVPLHLSSQKYYYHPSFAEDQLPINRSLDIINMRIEDFLLKYTKGQWLSREGSEFEFTDESGVVAKYDGEKPELMAQPALTDAPFNQMNNLFGYSERYGVSGLSMGKAPKGSNMRSADMITSVIGQELRQKKKEFDAYMDAIKKVADISMFFLNEMWKEPKSRFVGENDGDMKGVEFISDDMAQFYKDDTKNVVFLPKRLAKLKVTIDQNFGNSLEEKRQTIIQLAELKLLKNPKTILKYFAIGNVADLVLNELTEGSLLQNEEFMALVNDPNTPPNVKQALAQVLRFLAQQASLQQTDAGAAMPGGKPTQPAGGVVPVTTAPMMGPNTPAPKLAPGAQVPPVKQ